MDYNQCSYYMQGQNDAIDAVFLILITYFVGAIIFRIFDEKYSRWSLIRENREQRKFEFKRRNRFKRLKQFFV